jgi:DNA-binding FadR family transcriptional regulator
MNADDINTLCAILDEERRDIESGGCGHKSDEEFHIQLARFTDNTALYTIFVACQGILSKSINLTRQIPGQPRKALEGHRAIVKQIKAGNIQGAEEAMAAHLRQIYDCMNQLGFVDRQPGPCPAADQLQ